MHTQCPHCNTLFEITEEQISALEGKVRCGYCYRTFNAKETLINKLSENKHSPPQFQVNIAQPDAEVLETIDVAKQEFHADTREQLSEIPTTKKTSSLSAANVAWSFCVGALVITFVLQYAYFYRADLVQHPPARPFVSQLCQVFGCNMPLIEAPEKFKLISHDMRSHPDNDQALRVQGTFVNEADFSQPYPLIKLNLTDLNGKTVAYRNFSAEDYLTSQPSYEMGIPPSGKIDAELNIVDQGIKIVGFSLETLKK